MQKKNYNRTNIGLFFGSFNPIHIGHLLIASYMLNFTDLNEIWFVISPQSPFKKKSSLLSNYYRYDMLELAIKDKKNMYACDIEFKLSVPSYTINTLVHLKEKHPGRIFSLIMGSDNLITFNKWKNYEEILNEYKIYVYPRPNIKLNHLANHPSVILTKAPIIEISSSFIREAISNKKDVSFFLPDKVYQYIKGKHFYNID